MCIAIVIEICIICLLGYSRRFFRGFMLRSTHGTCAKAHSGITNQISFFNAAMNALHLVDVDHAFSNAGLVPSMTAKYTST